MRAILIIIFFVLSYLTVPAQAIYVDSNTGSNNNEGTKEAPVFSIQKAAELIASKNNDFCTMKINPGVYILDKHVTVATEKDMGERRIIIEASILPDDTSWTPEKMPVITCKALKGEIPESYHFVVSFLINESHVTIRGIKFHGYFYPQARYFPIARFNKTKTDLLLEQCMFIGDSNISQLQAGVIAHGNGVFLDHCVFYKVRNTAVFFLDSGNGVKNGNGISNSIIYGANQAVWTVSPDEDFVFENNIVSKCRYVWVKNDFNKTKYSIKNCIVTNNLYYTGIPDKERLKPGDFDIYERGVIRNGEISLRLIDVDDKPTLVSVDEPLPIDYMHVAPNTLGYEVGAGIFKTKK